jgi:hypothetical protein
MAPTFNSSTKLYSISGSHIKANYGVFSIIVCGVLRLHAVYGTNRIFSEKNNSAIRLRFRFKIKIERTDEN